jgi:predicted DNA-binding transcriptional regulator AlpA
MRLLTMDQLCEKLSCTRSTVYKITALGGLPLPIKLPTGGQRWVEEDVNSLIETIRPSVPMAGRSLIVSVGKDGLTSADIVNDSGADHVGVFQNIAEAATAGREKAFEIYGEAFPVAVVREFW